MAAKPIRLMIVDNSIFFREFMARTLAMDWSVDVVGVASSPWEAMQVIADLAPNMITLDIDNQNTQCREFLHRLRLDYPQIQVIIISPLSAHVFDALKAGAVDFVAKPNVQLQMDHTAFIKNVLAKIKTVYANSSAGVPLQVPAGVAVSGAQRMPDTVATAARSTPTAGVPTPQGTPALLTQNLVFAGSHKRIIAIGASTGGTEAILAVVKDLPAHTPGVVVVQHMPPVFTNMYAERLDKVCKMAAREAKNGDRVEPGLILVAPGELQMRVARDARGYYVRVEQGEKVSGHRPSVDVLFDSVATAAGRDAIGVILTGMGGDGAKNLLKMREAGAYTIGQDEATSVVYGMPMVAYTLGAVQDQLPLHAISGAILRHLAK